jgi:hypothetical protein
LVRIEVHPDGREHDQVEALLAAGKRRQFRRAVVHSIDPRRRMQRHCRPAQFFGRLKRYNAMPDRRKMDRIATDTGADIEIPNLYQNRAVIIVISDPAMGPVL